MGDEAFGPAMLPRVALVGVAGEQILVDEAIVLTVDAGWTVSG